MSEYRIIGGNATSGEVRIGGNKNAALPCLAATLLTDEPVRLSNVPEIEDVKVMIALLESLGSSVVRERKGVYTVRSGSGGSSLPRDLVQAVRGSILLLGPLLARSGEVTIPPPGGDVIGLRRLDTHFLGLTALGADATLDEDGSLRFRIAGKGLTGTDIFLDEASVTATENVLMAAALAEGETTVFNAACEPHVQDLCHLLVLMGSTIDGIGSNRLTIKGSKKLGEASYALGFDYMEAGSFIGLAAATGGEALIRGIDHRHLEILRLGFERIGIAWEHDGPSSILVPRKQRKVLVKDVGGRTTKIDSAPWPGFPADLLSILTVAATQSRGSILIHEKMFESRMYFIDWLIRMGADIILCDPHRAVVQGPSVLIGSVLSSPDVRAGMALVIAAAAARGESVIQNIYQIERGYEDLGKKLTSLGIDMVRSD
ncbi:MAG: UDP-N-acetylglucosamine 1-carboxyvinyltransferase [Spirochaetales bacterium]|nr:UDP-N-acetylglucosamine 1-carboxyvinyltransferase [Spirochaetales bacterium]